MTKPSITTLLTALCLITAPAVFAKSEVMECNRAFATSAPVKISLEVNSQWRKTDGNLFSAMRANASHNWAYFKKIKPRLGYLKEVFEIEGFGIGDFHILNIGDIELANGTRKIGLIDVDDGGRTSLFADFARAAISNQVSPYKVPLRDLWNSYIEGLGDKRVSPPKVIEEVLSKKHEDYLDMQKKYLAKLIDGKKFSAAAEIRPLSEADPLTKDIYQQSLEAIMISLGDVKVHDQGFKIKTSGGSQGVPRFWFLVEKHGKLSIVEFKTLAEPAMSQYEKQESQEARINSLISFYRPQKSTFELYGFVDGGKYQFVARNRSRGFLALNPEGAVSGKEAREGQDIYRYLAQRAGKWHCDQGSGKKLLELLTDKEEERFQEFESLVNGYIEAMKAANR